jgi:hypothetical protein
VSIVDAVSAATAHAELPAETAILETTSIEPRSVGCVCSTDFFREHRRIPFSRHPVCIWFVGLCLLPVVGAFVLAADFIFTCPLRTRAPATSFDGGTEVYVVVRLGVAGGEGMADIVTEPDGGPEGLHVIQHRVRR